MTYTEVVENWVRRTRAEAERRERRAISRARWRGRLLAAAGGYLVGLLLWELFK